MTSTLLKTLGLTAFSLFISINAKAEFVKDCSVLDSSTEEVSVRTLEKCRDLVIQKQPLFLGDGRETGIAACMQASSTSQNSGLNSCRTYAIEKGLSPSGCTQLVNVKTSNSYLCIYNSLYYLKGDANAFIGFTLDKETQTKLFEEAQSRSISVRQLINEKLRR